MDENVVQFCSWIYNCEKNIKFSQRKSFGLNQAAVEHIAHFGHTHLAEESLAYCTHVILPY